MIQKFGATSTSEDVLKGVDLRGKRVLITGVSAGLGVETARAFAAHGADVVGAARNLAKAEQATVAVRDAAAESGGSLELLELDLASLESVRTAADKLLAQGKPLDIVVANAGVMMTPFGHTVDGFETHLGINHLGHFVLINRIASLLKSGSRVISLSSSGHHSSDVDFEDPNFKKTVYEPYLAYARSKTASILFTVAFDNRHKDRGVRAIAVHPGGIEDTELARHMPPGATEAWIKQLNEELASEGKGPFVYKTVPQGTATTVWAAVVADSSSSGGRYCEDCHISRVAPNEAKASFVSTGVREYAIDPVHAERLWALSEDLVGERF